MEYSIRQEIFTTMRLLALLLCVISVVNGDVENGSLDERIVGGLNASDALVPSMVRIMTFNTVRCGGTIINNRHILTTAGCIYKENPRLYTVVAGTNYINKGGLTYSAEEFIWPRTYNRERKIDDIGLIRVIRDIQFSQTIQPAMLLSNSYVPAGANAFIVGWGQVNLGKDPVKLQAGYMEVMSLAQCESQLGGTFPTTKYICTRMVGRQAICFGDSGSPLIYNNVQIGIAAYMLRQCAPGSLDIYTMVSPFVPWIQSISGAITTMEISGSNPVNHANAWSLLSLTILTLLSYSYSLS